MMSNGPLEDITVLEFGNFVAYSFGDPSREKVSPVECNNNVGPAPSRWIY